MSLSLATNIFGLVLLTLMPGKAVAELKIFALILSIPLSVASLGIWLGWDPDTIVPQFPLATNFGPVFALDGLSLGFILLTTLLFPICVPSVWTTTLNVKLLSCCITLLEALPLGLSSIQDSFGFYIFFELILLPMTVIIGVWGSRARKIKALFYSSLHTLLGSLLMLLGLIVFYFEAGTTNLGVLATAEISTLKQYLLRFLFFVPFAVKIPMFPFHIWLPEAHVEAPTVGSVILAGLLLKLGGYGFVRVLSGVLPEATRFFSPMVLVLRLCGVLYASLTLLRQIDIKRIIAYSSVAHMNFSLLGVFAGTLEGLEGGVFLMLSHGISSSALFLLVGFLYERHHTRLLHYSGGLAQLMPLFATNFFLFTLANFGFPGTANSVGEFLTFVGVVNSNLVVAVIVMLGIVLSVVYSILLYNRVCFGELKFSYLSLAFAADLSRREFFIMLPLAATLLGLGFYPRAVTTLLHGAAILAS